MKHHANRTLFIWWLLPGLIFLLTGCPTSSEWDRQWEQIHANISRGQFQEAKDLLHHLLPSFRKNGPTDERYALVIFQLGEVARLEGQESQAEAYYWEALPLLAESLGSEHLRMADPLTALALLYQQKNQLEMARPLLKRALAIREKSWGLSDPQLLSTLQTYHALLLAGDHQEEAREIAGRIDRILKRSS
ncbi:tetratricopeptide repeat protein [uncultured Nitrospira sp.]|uniref:tetratricopeptide repeat protein n=1 Tax=uncultured Nitrospira sp. TaxID=157176 RepID=UPI003140C68B